MALESPANRTESTSGLADRTRTRVYRALFADTFTVTSLVVIASFVLLALFAPQLSTDPLQQDIFQRSKGISVEHVLGTDTYGRDVLSRILWGGRVSLLLGVAAPLIAGLLGTFIGMTAGYMGGWIDGITTRFTDIFMSFPTLLLGVMITATLGAGFTNVIIAISVALLPRFIRLARGSCLAVREEPYIEASVAAGQRPLAIIFMHVLPNISGPIIVMSTLWIATAIRLEASLSFLGLGTQPPNPSWGNMVREGLNNLMGSPLPAVFAGLAITLLVISFNVVGDSLRDALDPEL